MNLNKIIRTFYNVFFSRRLSYLVFFITSVCNSRCRTCFNWRVQDNMDANKDISLNEIRKFLKKTGFIPFISISGGEPFLRDDLDLILKEIAFYTSPYMINIPTNASLKEKIKKTVRTFFAETNDVILQIELSLDGLNERHDMIRGREGSFKEVINTLNCLKRLKKRYPLLRLKINSTYNSYNRNDFEKLVRFVSEQGVDGFSYSYLMGDIRQAESKTIIDSFIVKRNQAIVKKYIGKNKVMLSAFMNLMQYRYKKELLNLLKKGRYLHRCLAGKKIAVVREDSNVYLCENENMKVSDLKSLGYDLNRIKNNEIFKNIRKTQIDTHKCDCGWSCELLLNSVIRSVKEIPKLIKEMI